jgi:pentatricopeptide repeat protein
MYELSQHMDLMTNCLNKHDEGVVTSHPIDILKEMMSLYTKWCFVERPSSQLKFTVSAHIDQAFRIVTNKAFSNPHQLNWVNTGMEALRLQLHSEKYNTTSVVEGVGIRLISLQQPYDEIPKGTWLKALRSLTSDDVISPRIPSSTRSIKVLSPKDDLQWITPSNAAFRILQRLVTGNGIRTFRRRNRSLHQQSLDERDFNMVLHAYAAHPKYRYMHAAHRVMALQERTVHAPPLSPVAYSIMVRAYGQSKDIVNVETSILHAQRNGVIPDVVMANTVVDAYINCGLLDKAQEIFHSMSLNGRSKSTEDCGFWPLLQPNSRTYNTLLKGMAEEGDVRGAMVLSNAMLSQGLWDKITTNTLVKAAVTANEYDLAEAILSNHTVSDFSSKLLDHPNVEAYTELIDGYAKDGKLDHSLRVLQLMQKRGVTPNSFTYTCIVGALARNNRIRPARKMINYAASVLLSEGGGVELAPVYNAFISGLLTSNSCSGAMRQSSHTANIVEVLEVVQEMQSINIDPNVVTVVLVIDGLGRCNPPRCKEAKELVSHLGSRASQKLDCEVQNVRGISLSNKRIATALIQAFGRANDVDSAMETFDRITSADVVAFNSLLDVCCRCNQVKLALDLFKKHISYETSEKFKLAMNASMGQKLIVPDVVTYTTLISALLQLKTRAAVKRAASLYIEMKQKMQIYPDTILIDT